MSKEGATSISNFLLRLLIFIFIGEVKARQLQQICSSSCGDIKNISYPFRLKDDPVGCGRREVELSCQSNKTIIEFNWGKYYVKRISYNQSIMRVVDVNLANGSCSLPTNSLPKEMFYKIFYDYSGLQVLNQYAYANFLNCSGNNIDDSIHRNVPCLSGNESHVVVAINNQFDNRILDAPELCLFISTIPILRDDRYPSYDAIRKSLESGFELKWSVECWDCIAAGGLCGNMLDRFQCDRKSYLDEIWSAVLYITGSFLLDLTLVLLITGRFVFAPIVVIVYLVHKYKATRKAVDNVEKFLHNQQSWMPKRYSCAELMAVTNNFKDKLGQGGFGSVYKGQLHNGSMIAVKILENTKFSGEEFINEVSTLGRIHHVNVVRLVGFCSEESTRALVYTYMPNGSLDRYLFSKRSEGQSFSWEKLLEIAVGIARGIEYLHGGCDVCILHFDIKPDNILLDDHFIPKVSDFGLAKFYPRENDFVSMSATRGTIGYIAPELISRNFGAVSCKSDVYSFGMLLLEMAGGRRNSVMKATHSSKAYFPSWVYDQINKGGDLELPNVSEMEVVIAKKLCIIGLWCIQVKPAERPSITKAIEMLEGSIDELRMPPKPFFSSSQCSSIREIQSDSSTELIGYESIWEECSHNDNHV